VAIGKLKRSWYCSSPYLTIKAAYLHFFFPLPFNSKNQSKHSRVREGGMLDPISRFPFLVLQNSIFQPINSRPTKRSPTLLLFGPKGTCYYTPVLSFYLSIAHYTLFVKKVHPFCFLKIYFQNYIYLLWKCISETIIYNLWGILLE